MIATKGVARLSKLTWTEAGYVLLFGLLLVQALIWQPWRLMYNYTVSEPLGIYLYHKVPAGFEPRTGDLVVFQYRAPGWAQFRGYAPDGALVLKQVGAVAGSRLIVNGRAVYGCAPGLPPQSCPLLGKALTADSRGRALPAPPFAAESLIPKGYLYMQSTRVPNSYDSRYFGLVPVTALRGEAIPLLVWGK